MSVIVVTGASRGIGSATAITASILGYSVAINYLNDKMAANNVLEQIKQNGGNAIAVQADVSTEEGVTKLFKIVDKKLGTLTALFANAGIVHKYATITDYKATTLEKIWRTNITSQFLSFREAVLRMSKSQGGPGGSIVIMSSAASRLGGGPLMAYAASKGASDTLTIGLAQEVAKQGIRVNAVRPGLIDTKIHDNTGDLSRIQKLVGGVPLGRIGSTQEVADTVLWLLSDKASYVTGSIVDVSGGR